MPRTTAPAIYTFRVTLIGGLADFGPDIWRDIEIVEDQTLEDLGHAIPDAFDFDEEHMWSFFLSGKPWDRTTEYPWHGPLERPKGAHNPARLRIRDAPLKGKRGGTGWLFIFDYGDEWHFDVAFRGAETEIDPKARYPRVAERHGKEPPQYQYAEDEWDDEDEDDDLLDDEELTGEDAEALAELEEMAKRDPELVRAAVAQLEEVLKNKQFDSPEEMEAYLDSGEWLRGQHTDETLVRAQEVVNQAWEAPGSKDRVRLAREALEISADCVEAYLILAMDTASSPQEEINLYRQAVAAGERTIRPEVFTEGAVSVSDLFETRPYLRARAELAAALWKAGLRDEALEHWEEMLRLDPGDTQEVRYPLLNSLLERGDLDRAETLIDEYPDDEAADWIYGETLYSFAREGDTEESREILLEAEEVNPFVPAYLTSKKRLPRNISDVMELGSMEEAQWCASEQMAAWKSVPGALEWLTRQSRPR